jgi:hypothetical protein
LIYFASTPQNLTVKRRDGMATNGRWPMVMAVAFCVLAVYATHIYAQHQAYHTGVYMGHLFFTTADFQNQQCLKLQAASLQPGCEVTDLNNESVMEHALATAYIVPSMSESNVAAIHTGFRDGWRKARTAAGANR